ncbi:MAG: enoyl-CoA hydratase/isomerase family protein [Dongiaceae bacterium]
MSDTVLFSEADGLGTVTFNRPMALNACDLDMVGEIDAALRRWRQDDRIKAVLLRGDGFRAFSAGGDLRAVYRAGTSGDQAYLTAFLRAEYRLLHLWATYPKKTIALVNGISMGLGAALAAAARVRVVTDLTLFATPECRIGLMPDLGAGLFLNRCPGKIGLFLALTGMEIRAPGMIYAGLGTHFLPPERVDVLAADNADDLALPVGQVPLAQIQPEIDRSFGQRSLAEVITVLSARNEQGFRDILGQIQRSPALSLQLTFTHLTRAAALSLDDVLKQEYRVTRRLLRQAEPMEGIRARLIDRDGAPRWQERDPAKITPAVVESYFAPLTDEPELYFQEN